MQFNRNWVAVSAKYIIFASNNYRLIYGTSQFYHKRHQFPDGPRFWGPAGGQFHHILPSITPRQMSMV